MKKTLVFMALLIPTMIFAKDELRIAPIADASSVELQLQAERWVNTTTALVTVSSDATIEKGALTQTREQILQKMNSLAANVNWNITVFNIAQNESGLEQLHVEAQARISEDKLGNLRDKAKEVSKPGLTIRILNVDFSPSLAEIEKAKSQLREQIYNDVKDEIAQVNKQYSGQNYNVRSIAFQSSLQQPQPMPLNAMMFVGGRDGVAKSGAAGENTMLSVSTKIQMSAAVQLATAGSTFGRFQLLEGR